MELLSKSEDRTSPYQAMGKILAPHGLRGALKVHCLSDFPEQLLNLDQAYLLTDPQASTGKGPFVIADVQPVKGKTYLVYLQGVEDRSAAEAFDKLYICIPADQVLDLPEDTYYARELIGFEVLDTQGQLLGSVSQVIQSHQDLIVLKTPAGSEHWIPFVHELVPEVDLKAKRLVVSPIEGLLET